MEQSPGSQGQERGEQGHDGRVEEGVVGQDLGQATRGEPLGKMQALLPDLPGDDLVDEDDGRFVSDRDFSEHRAPLGGLADVPG